jgi:hypothetical protein
MELISSGKNQENYKGTQEAFQRLMTSNQWISVHSEGKTKRSLLSPTAIASAETRMNSQRMGNQPHYISIPPFGLPLVDKLIQLLRPTSFLPRQTLS